MGMSAITRVWSSSSSKSMKTKTVTRSWRRILFFISPPTHSTHLLTTPSSSPSPPPPMEMMLGGPATWQMYRHHLRSLCTGTSPAEPTSKSSSETKQGGNGDHNNEKQQQQQQQGKPVRGGPVSWLSFLLLAATGAGLILYYDRVKTRHIEEINTASTAVKQGPSAGKAAIGGPFNLVDHNGKAVTDKDFIGNWTVIYFGFTHCPDICPDELQKLAAAVDKIKNKSGIEIVPIFISVDPERDNVEQVHEYVKEFHPALIGLTGTPEEIKKVARAFRVYYMKTDEEGSDYLVDHSIVMYLMDPTMEFVKFYGKNNDVDSLTDGIIKEIKQFRKPKA